MIRDNTESGIAGYFSAQHTVTIRNEYILFKVDSYLSCAQDITAQLLLIHISSLPSRSTIVG